MEIRAQLLHPSSEVVRADAFGLGLAGDFLKAPFFATKNGDM